MKEISSPHCGSPDPNGMETPSPKLQLEKEGSTGKIY
jgi:hypothetical protein